MRLSEKLWGIAQYMLARELMYEYNTLISAAVVIEQAEDATTPRPWPPPEATKRCLIWRKGMGWFVDEPWSWLTLDKDIRPQFWLPMPPEPEVGP